MKRRQLQPGREVRNALSIGKGERVFDGDHRIRALLSRSLECALEVVRASHLKGLNLDLQRPACPLGLLKDNRGVWIGRTPRGLAEATAP
jgi:hypothetical protein